MALRWQGRYEWRPKGRLEVDQRQGRTAITGWDQSHVEVVAEFLDADERIDIRDLLEVDPRSAGLSIRVKHKPRWFHWGMNRCNLTIRVPYATQVDLDSGQGEVEIEWVQGPVDVDSGQGQVRLRGLGDTTVDTGQGDVTVIQHQGSLDVDTGMGKIYLERVRGREIDIDTGMGDVRAEGVEAHSLRIDGGAGALNLRGIAVQELDVESGMGRVEVELVSLHPRGEYEIETGAGTLDLYLPREADAELRLETGLGRVRLDLPGVQREGSRGGETRLVLGRGGASIHLESGMGAVFVGTTNAQTVAAAAAGMAPAEPYTGVRQDELERILQMVAEGKLSPQEAETLIGTLENK